MSAPTDSSINAGGFRFYRWEPADGSEPTDVLSVTSIRRLCGEQYNLVAWQIANVCDVALGTAKRTIIGPRGGVKEVRLVEEFPAEFARRYAETEGHQSPIDALRKWLRDSADEPRNIAANRGTLVHLAIEKGVRADQIERPWVEAAFKTLSTKDQKRVRNEVTDDDIAFIHNAMRQYEDMRAHVPFVILAREPQVWNLTAGYAGSADVMIWFLPDGTADSEVKHWQRVADMGELTIDNIKAHGGHTTLGDWKTSGDVYTDQVVQVTAYMAAEFIGSGGVVDERLTAILNDMKQAALIHIRPNKWAVHYVDFEMPVLTAFLGSCAFARFLATYPKPDTLFTHDVKGNAPTDE